MARNLHVVDSSSAPKPNLTADTFLQFFGELIQTRRAAEQAASLHRLCLKRAKAAGVDLPSINAALKLTRQDPDEVDQHYATLSRYMAWAGQPIGHQTDLFTDEPTSRGASLRDTVWWHDSGYRAGLAGESADANPHPPGAPAFVKWQQGQQDGADFRAKSKPATDETTRKPRKRGGGNPEDRLH